MLLNMEQFPPDRRADTRRRAEARVFDAIQASERLGFACYEWQRNPGSPQLDFAIWTLGGGRFGLQVKGGQHSLEHGKWYLETRDGREEKPSPLCQTWDAAMSLREDIIDILGDTCCFVIAVLLFPDMEPDPAIAAAAKRKQRPRPLGHGQPDEPAGGICRQKGLLPAQRRGYPPGGDHSDRRADRLRRRSPGAAGSPGGPQGGNPCRRHHHRARGHPDCPHRAGRGDGRRQGPGTREPVQAPEPHETTGGRLPGMTARLRTHPESRGSGRNNFTIQHNQTFQEEET